MGFLMTYFVWLAIYGKDEILFGYQLKQMLTYIVLGRVVGSLVYATRTQKTADEINQGDLSNFLLKPFSYFSYLWAYDFADKAINLFFSIFELSFLIFILKPSLVFQTNPGYLFLFIISIFLGVFLYFNFSLLISFIGFWSPETWAPRFIFWILLDFLAGNFVPLDVFPRILSQTLSILPFSYFVFFPLKIYLGQLGLGQLLTYFSIGLFWLWFLNIMVNKVWQKGLKIYTAEGR